MSETYKKHINEWTRKDLMGLPVRSWDEESEYDSLLLLSTRKKHDSGWAIIAIIGVKDTKPVEIACSCCDDIEWKLPTAKTYGGGMYSDGQLRMDCGFRSGALHAWKSGSRFIVGSALSSTTVKVIEKDTK